MSKRIVVILLLLSCSSSVAFGYVMGTSNFGLSGYPSFASKTYSKPRPPYTRDQYSMENYRREVNKYIDEYNNYVEASQNDMRRIKEAMEEAQRDVNEVIAEYNRYK